MTRNPLPTRASASDADSVVLISRSNTLGSIHSTEGVNTPPESDIEEQKLRAIEEAVKPHSDLLLTRRRSTGNSKLPMLSLILTGLGVTVSLIGPTHIPFMDRFQALESGRIQTTVHDLGSEQTAVILHTSPEALDHQDTKGDHGEEARQKLDEIIEAIKELKDGKKTGAITDTVTVTVTVTAEPSQPTSDVAEPLTTPYNFRKEVWDMVLDRFNNF